MCFGESSNDPLWYGYIDDGQGWTARPKSEYMKTPEYNKELRREMKAQRRQYGRAKVPHGLRYKKWE